MPATIRNLSELSAHELEFGGKACGLASLLAAGARVPEGFALRARRAGSADWLDVEREEFRRRCDQLLAGGLLAVRSSAVGEDGADRSFAGMFDTVLGVDGVEHALAAADRCIGSAVNARVLAYAEQLRSVGIVVQRQIDARVAGVCFTTDPTGRDSALLIEAVPGPGEGLVSGRVQPQRWRVYRSGLGSWELRDEGTGRSDTALPGAEVLRIAEEARRYAEALGRPLDLEWAIDDEGVLWWLQARPITAAAPPPVWDVQRAFAGVEDGPVTVWFNWNVRETMPDPLLPLTWSLWRDAILPMVTSQIFGTPMSSPIFDHLLCLDLVHGRIYFNMNGILAWPMVGRLMRGTLMRLVDPGGADALGALIDAGVLQPRRLPGRRTRVLLEMVMAGLLNAPRFFGALFPRRAMRRMRAFEAEMRRRACEQPVQSLADAQLVSEMQLLVLPICNPLRAGLHDETVAIAVYHRALRAFRDHPEASRLLAVGIAGNPTTQISLELDRLIQEARPLAALFRAPGAPAELIDRLRAEKSGALWLQRLEEFLGRFGHRCPKEFDLGAPRWAEDPEMILELVRTGLETSGEPVAARMRRLAAERKAALEAAISRSALWRRPLLRSMARLVELYMPLREAPKHYAMLAFQRMRQAALEAGRRLQERACLRIAEDVFFLQLQEIAPLLDGAPAPADLSDRIEERRASFDRYCRERAPDCLRSDGVPIVEPAPDSAAADGLLRGTGISTGVGTGPARILLRPDPRAMRDGDVMVVELADPGWTPLFPRAAGIIMEVGGIMCHAAVVARELGIPAVFGVSRATKLLRDGDQVAVDGNRGTVARISED